MTRRTALRPLVPRLSRIVLGTALFVECLLSLPKSPALAQTTASPPTATPPVGSPAASVEPKATVGQPGSLASQATVPQFPGSGLFNDHPPFLAGVKVNHSDLTYRAGDTLSVEFTAEREAYLYLLYHQADGSSLLLFPNEARSDGHVAANQSVTVPQPNEEFRFRVAAPFGAEVLQVVASLKPLEDLDTLVQKSGRAATVSSEVLTRLIPRLTADPTSWTEHRVPIRTTASAEASPTRKPARVGLFVGVNLFERTAEKGEGDNARFRLGAELMAQTMLQRGGLDPQRTQTLIGQQATRANIEAAITRWLPSITQPGDNVFIFYAGHGGLIKNLDGTKPDGKDGILTTYNDAFESQKQSEDEWDANARKSFISDITLARWLQELPGRQITLLISSCHAGSMIDATLLAKFASREVVRVKGISALNVVVLASCSTDEQTLSATKTPVFLAQYLSEAMTQLPTPVTLEQAFDYYRQAHRRRMEQDGTIGYHEPVLTDTALLPIVLVPAPKTEP